MPEVPKINMAENRNEHGKPEKENSLPDDALKNVSGGMELPSFPGEGIVPGKPDPHHEPDHPHIL